MLSNGKLLGTLCEKRHDAVVVMDNKHFITLVSVHIAILHANSCNKVYLQYNAFTCILPILEDSWNHLLTVGSSCKGRKHSVGVCVPW